MRSLTVRESALRFRKTDGLIRPVLFLGGAGRGVRIRAALLSAVKPCCSNLIGRVFDRKAGRAKYELPCRGSKNRRAAASGSGGPLIAVLRRLLPENFLKVHLRRRPAESTFNQLLRRLVPHPFAHFRKRRELRLSDAERPERVSMCFSFRARSARRRTDARRFLRAPLFRPFFQRKGRLFGFGARAGNRVVNSLPIVETSPPPASFTNLTPPRPSLRDGDGVPTGRLRKNYLHLTSLADRFSHCFDL